MQIFDPDESSLFIGSRTSALSYLDRLDDDDIIRESIAESEASKSVSTSLAWIDGQRLNHTILSRANPRKTRPYNLDPIWAIDSKPTLFNQTSSSLQKLLKDVWNLTKSIRPDTPIPSILSDSHDQVRKSDTTHAIRFLGERIFNIPSLEHFGYCGINGECRQNRSYSPVALHEAVDDASRNSTGIFPDQRACNSSLFVLICDCRTRVRPFNRRFVFCRTTPVHCACPLIPHRTPA